MLHDGKQFFPLHKLCKLESDAIPRSIVKKKLTDSLNDRLFDVTRWGGGVYQ